MDSLADELVAQMERARSERDVEEEMDREEAEDEERRALEVKGGKSKGKRESKASREAARERDGPTEVDDAAFRRALSTVSTMLEKRGYFDFPRPENGRRFPDFNALTWKKTDEEARLWIFFSTQVGSMERYDALLDSTNTSNAILVVRSSATKRKPGPRYEVFSFAQLAFDPTSHVLQPEFTLLTDSQRDAVLKAYGTDPSIFPKMRADDAVAAFFGAKPGAMFKIVRKSDTAIKGVMYRIVIPA